MFKLIGAKKAPYDGDDINEVLKEFLCDTDADFANLPQCDPGSMAVSIESGKVSVVNTEGKWVEFGVPSDNGIVGTWVFNDEIDISDKSIYGEFSFQVPGDETILAGKIIRCGTTGPGVQCMEFLCDMTYSTNIGKAVYCADNNYGFTVGWQNEAYKTITILEEPTGEAFITWLKENATKVG